MTHYLVLLAPSANRVYTDNAAELSAAELEILLKAGGDRQNWQISPTTVAGVDYLDITWPGQEASHDLAAAEQQLMGTAAMLSAFLALFRREGDHLIPREASARPLFDDDLVTIPKYQGKTNEQFTQLVVNVTAAAVERSTNARLQLLDPMCGRGTTLSVGLRRGYDVAGVEIDSAAVEGYAAFLRTYLRRKKLKHSADLHPVRREGKSLGRRLEVAIGPPRGDRLRLDVFTGDTRQSLALFGKRRFDLIVTDAPYGVVHGSSPRGKGQRGHRPSRDRSPATLLAEAVPIWAEQLRAGGAVGISWNTYGLSRTDLIAIIRRAGLTPQNEGPWQRLCHRVDSAIQRDVLVAVKSPAQTPAPSR